VTAVLHGLHAAHEATDESGASLGLVHRDVSPQNVLVGSDGVARLIDFGIAKAACRGSASKNGQLKGKVSYMAPEQIRGLPVDRRVDVYGASVLLWELLAGEKLFDGETEGMILGRVLDDLVPEPSSLRSDVPRALDQAILRGLSRAPEARPPTPREQARALEAAVRPAPAAELAEWVQSLAEPALRDRAARLARMEREALGEDEPRARPETASVRPRAEAGFWARWLQSLDVMIRGDRARSR
jgi:serine/threonine-protein kinase